MRHWLGIGMIGIVMLTGLFAPMTLYAAEDAPEQVSTEVSTESGLVQCGVGRDCTICDIFILIRDIFNFILQMLGTVGVISIVIGGVYMILASGNPGMYQQGVQIIQHAITGLVLAASSFLIFGFGLQALGFQEQNFTAVFSFDSGNMFEIQCDNAAAFNDRGGWGTGVASLGGNGRSASDLATGTQGIACLASTSIPVETRAVMRAITYYEGSQAADGYYILVGGTQYPSSQIVHPASEDTRLFSKTGLNSDAYGRYQMINTTWSGWAARAGVPLAKQGQYVFNGKSYPFFNMSPEYQDAAVAKTLEDNNANTCESFINSSYRCQWSSIQGCSQQNSKTQSIDFRSLCQELLAEEQSGKCS